jgi:hypothetical protein
MKPAYYPKASSDEGVTMQFDLVCFGEARSMIDQPREQMAASGPSRHFVCAQQSGRSQVKADIKWQARSAASIANDPNRKF